MCIWPWDPEQHTLLECSAFLLVAVWKLPSLSWGQQFSDLEATEVLKLEVKWGLGVKKGKQISHLSLTGHILQILLCLYFHVL